MSIKLFFINEIQKYMNKFYVFSRFDFSVNMTMQNKLLLSHNAIVHFCMFKRAKEYKNIYMSPYSAATSCGF